MEEGGLFPTQNDAAVSPARAQSAPVQSLPPKGRVRQASVVAVVLALTIVAALRVLVYESDIVEGTSMHPGLHSGDYVLMSKLAYRGRVPKRFDIITFRQPNDPHDVVIKRVVGLPGEWVWVWGNQVFVTSAGRDSGRLSEPYVSIWRGDFQSPVQVPSGSVYALGDNRDDSEDSRVWGPVPLSSVRGKALFVYFPPGRARVVR